MRVTDFAAGISAEFTLRRYEDRLYVDLIYSLQRDEGQNPKFNGSIVAKIGSVSKSLEGTSWPFFFDMAGEASTTGTTIISYSLTDNIAGISFDHEFSVTILDVASNFVGTSAVNLVYGSSYADQFRSEGAGDKFEGGDGSDLYRIYDAYTRVFESESGGTSDRIAAGVSYVLRRDIEVETLTTNGSTGTAAINLTGNKLSQTIYGNAGANVLADGGELGDEMFGLGGDDTYVVYSPYTVVHEGAGEGGGDRIATGLMSYELSSGLDIEFLTTTDAGSTRAVNLTGNELAQTIIGNAGNNVLDSADGADDVLVGGRGNDTYRVFNTDDIIIEGDGQGVADRVFVCTSVYNLGADARVEILTTDNVSGIHSGIRVLRGNDFAQTIIGNYMDYNSLDGGGGNDTLTGDEGKDSFVFSTALGSTNVDTITDFTVVDDYIQLRKTIFTAIAGSGSIQPGYFCVNSTGTAQDASDHIIYETDTGKLFYDADGNGAGAAVQFATLAGNPTITAADFVLF